MDWDQAKDIIRKKVIVGTDLNTRKSSYRFVISVDSAISSDRYGYSNEIGYRVRIGKSQVIPVPWGMLEKCFRALYSESGYNSRFFCENFPTQADDHPCYVHVVGQIFVRAGLAREEGNSYKAVS